MSDVRVRFAPSPTGYLHIGGVRTALFNWLFARHHKGKLILRIEDTDQSRSTDESIRAIIDGMKWLGLDWDEGPFRQTERMALYHQHADRLLAEGKAYRCYCLPEELEERRKAALAAGKTPKYDGRCRELTKPIEGRPAALRFKAPHEGETVIEDLVKGKVTFDRQQLDDLIIIRSDGWPTYNFCVVVDDALMNITHVIRGDDHLNNTPRQIPMFEAFNYPVPKFAHLSMILGPDKARLSKRHGATSIMEYKKMGFLPEAMMNYLVRLGWSYKDQEVFSLNELIGLFSFESVGSSAAVFNPEKLLWLNAHYLKTGDPDRFAHLMHSQMHDLGLIDGVKIEETKLKEIYNSLRERSRDLNELVYSAIGYFVDEIQIESEARKKLGPEAMGLLKEIREKLAPLPMEHEPLEKMFKEVMAKTGKKMGEVAQPLRIALTGKTVSPGIYDVLRLLGKERALLRIDRAVQLLSP
ncbi:MAG: glutamate--tRNA ligase [Nitrospirae bacterium]|nr:glutamate--tRNA ligase [Nitrospirota bacterium]MBI3352498.1 glutamate--tRNA ligase [Nitrospirota bacterium]